MSIDSDTIVLTERQASEVNGATALELLKDPTFNALLDAGIFELVRSRRGKFAIKGAQFVGRAILTGGRDLVVSEKVPGAIAGMLPWASPTDMRSLLIKSHITESSDMLKIIVRHFLRSVAEYISRGPSKVYSKDLVTTLNPRGKLNVPSSVRLRAKGIYGRVACRPSRLTGVTRINSLIALSLLCLEGCQNVVQMDAEDIAKARAFLPYFAECDFHSLRRMPLHVRASLFREELESPFSTLERQNVLGYGRAIALHAMSTFGHLNVAEIPGAYFINLETLFEDAVLSCLKDSLSPVSVFRPREIDRVSILDASDDRYLASPDALWETGKNQHLVADCKYKVMDGAPAHSDIYQILAHAEAYKASNALLFYPSDKMDVKCFGSSRKGTQVWAASLRCSNLREDVGAVISTIYAATRRELTLSA